MRRQIRGRWRRIVGGAAEEVRVENFIRSPKQALFLYGLPLSQRVPERSLEAIAIDTHRHTHRVTPPADDATHRSIRPSQRAEESNGHFSHTHTRTESLVDRKKDGRENVNNCVTHTERKQKNRGAASDVVAREKRVPARLFWSPVRSLLMALW